MADMIVAIGSITEGLRSRDMITNAQQEQELYNHITANKNATLAEAVKQLESEQEWVVKLDTRAAVPKRQPGWLDSIVGGAGAALLRQQQHYCQPNESIRAYLTRVFTSDGFIYLQDKGQISAAADDFLLQFRTTPQEDKTTRQVTLFEPKYTHNRTIQLAAPVNVQQLILEYESYSNVKQAPGAIVQKPRVQFR